MKNKPLGKPLYQQWTVVMNKEDRQLALVEVESGSAGLAEGQPASAEEPVRGEEPVGLEMTEVHRAEDGYQICQSCLDPTVVCLESDPNPSCKKCSGKRFLDVTSKEEEAQIFLHQQKLRVDARHGYLGTLADEDERQVRIHRATPKGAWRCAGCNMANMPASAWRKVGS